MEEKKDECKEVSESENSCKLTELFARISETFHAKENPVLNDQTDSEAAVETHPAAQEGKAPRKSRHHSTLAQDIELLTKSLRQEGGGGSDHKQDDQHAKEVEKPAPQERKSARVQDPSIPSQASQKLAESNKLEDQINLQHLIELMRIFHVRMISSAYAVTEQQ